MSRETIFFTWSDLISSSLISIFISSYNLDTSILITTLLLALVFSRLSSKDVVVEEICLSCSMIFDEKLVLFSLIAFIFSKSKNVTNLILTS